MTGLIIKRLAIFCLFVAFLVAGCRGKASDAPTDTYDEGTIHISVDESFKPVIDAQIQIYESSYPKTKIIAHYKPEAECLRDFATDSIRLIIATRGYTKNEEIFLHDSMKVDPTKMVVAYDAVAVIVHPQSVDTLFTMQQVKDLLAGRLQKKMIPVFDGKQATSTVRFIIDSVLRNDTLSAKAVAARSSTEVIDYVSKTTNAVGFIGVSWIGNPNDSTHLTYLQKVRVAQVEHPLVPDVFVTPAQYNIYYRRYPMVRDLVYTLKEKHRGLGHGFANFLTTQRGQLIFHRAYLMPALMTFDIRGATLQE